MFKISRSLQARDYTPEQLFDALNNDIENLADRWSLKEPQVKPNEEGLEIILTSKHFKGNIKVKNKEVQIEGEFDNLFNFNKAFVEEELDNWLQKVFQETYDS